jgi:hypothetical protein
MRHAVPQAVVGRVTADQLVADQSAADPGGEGGELLRLARPVWSERGSVQRRWLKRFGAAGFSFFLLKGLFWLTVPALLAYFGRH